MPSKTHKITQLIFFLFILAGVSSCSLLLNSDGFGYHESSDFNDEKYRKFVNSIDTSQLTYFKSSAAQFEAVHALVTDSIRLHDLKQPIQMLYFEGNNLVSYQANCYAKGSLSGIDWNFDNRFQSFPPKSAVECNTFKINLDDFTKIYEGVQPAKKFTVIVFWSWMLEGVSRDAISMVQENIKNNNVQNKVDVYLINIEEFWKAMN